MKTLKSITIAAIMLPTVHAMAADLVYNQTTFLPANGQVTDIHGAGFYKDGKLHRNKHPAMVYNSGTKEWYINGKLHREDGPAIVTSYGLREWYINGREYSEMEFNKLANSRFSTTPTPTPQYSAEHIIININN